MNALFDMSPEKRTRSFLDHPAIHSFLFYKWNRLGRFYNLNIKFFTFLTVILTWYITELNTLSPGIDCPIYHTNNGTCSESIKLRDWSKQDTWFAMFFIGILATVFFSFRQMLRIYCDRREQNFWKKSKKLWFEIGILFASLSLMLPVLLFTNILEIYLWLLSPLVLLRECLQIYSSLKSLKLYLTSMENYAEILLPLLIFITLIVDSEEVLNEIYWKKYIHTLAILISWALVIEMVARHPRINMSVYLTMFCQVMKKSMLVLAIYSPFIVVFGIAFFILKHDSSEEGSFFDNPESGVMKTFIMFIGEIELGDTFPLGDETTETDVFTYIFLIFFVFIIVIVLMNLLNALAIDVTSELEKQAEILSICSSICTLYHLENNTISKYFLDEDAPKISLKPNIEKTYWLILKDFLISDNDFQLPKPVLDQAIEMAKSNKQSVSKLREQLEIEHVKSLQEQMQGEYEQITNMKTDVEIIKEQNVKMKKDVECLKEMLQILINDKNE